MEMCIEYPEELADTDKILEKIMEDASGQFCKFSKIPAAASTGKYWIH